MRSIDAIGHVRGESVYLDDVPLWQQTLYACVYDSKIAHGRILHIDIQKASAMEGVVCVMLAKDIPGVNQIGGIIADEPLLAETHVHFQGMPIALVIAETDAIAREAVHLIEAEIEPLPVITDPREAFLQNELIIPSKRFHLGDVEDALKKCQYVYHGRADVNGQEHLYIETHGAYAIPAEGGGLKVYSSTQGPTAVQRTISRVTGLGMKDVEVDVGRLGGGFGGKEDQANAWAAFCALGALKTGRPVKYSLHRLEDMRMTGKRHPYSADYTIGLDEDLKILAYDVVFYQNAGAAADLSPAVLERTLFHCTNSYFIPHVRATAHSCRTHLPPNTAFRGFGGPQGMFVIEAAIAHAAEQINVRTSVIQARNLIQKGQEFPYGQLAEQEAVDTWKHADAHFQFDEIKNKAAAFNATNPHYKKGIAVMPVCFGISFTKKLMNQARALVHIYTDGSVAVATGAVEMGQGVNTKMLQVVAQALSISPDRVRLMSTNTYRIANTSPSAASATADLNGRAAIMACDALLSRLKKVAIEEWKLEATPEDITIRDERVWNKNHETDIQWNVLINAAYSARVSLSEHAHYATPQIHFDWTTAKGHPFAYHVYGTCITQVTLDVRRGVYTIDFVRGIHDFGKPMNQDIDMGQIEGGIVQGIGWMTMEEILYDEKGRLKSNALSTYKIPDVYSIPDVMDIQPLPVHNDNLALLSSKAVGEPPLMYGIGVYFAIRDAIRAKDSSLKPAFDAPYTPEKVLLDLYPDFAP